MKKLILLVIFMLSLTLNAQVTISSDTTALKNEVSKHYKELGALADIDDYNNFIKSAETLYPLMQNNESNRKTIALWLSESYYDMARKFQSSEQKTTMAKQMNTAYLTPELRRQYLMKAKGYLEDYLGYKEETSPDSFQHINNQLNSL